MRKTVDKQEVVELIAEIREAFADYMASEGCSCCRDTEGHGLALARLEKLLVMDRYSDGSGVDYAKYVSTNASGITNEEYRSLIKNLYR